MEVCAWLKWQVASGKQAALTSCMQQLQLQQQHARQPNGQTIKSRRVVTSAKLKTEMRQLLLFTLSRLRVCHTEARLHRSDPQQLCRQPEDILQLSCGCCCCSCCCRICDIIYQCQRASVGVTTCGGSNVHSCPHNVNLMEDLC